MFPFRLFGALGGLTGAAGVALSAAASHAGGANTATIASFLLFHAPALLLVGSSAYGRRGLAAGCVLAAGLALFAGDLAARDVLGHRLFPFAAPAGGLLLIAGWLILGVVAAMGVPGSGAAGRKSAP